MVPSHLTCLILWLEGRMLLALICRMSHLRLYYIITVVILLSLYWLLVDAGHHIRKHTSNTTTCDTVYGLVLFLFHSPDHIRWKGVCSETKAVVMFVQYFNWASGRFPPKQRSQRWCVSWLIFDDVLDRVLFPWDACYLLSLVFGPFCV